MTYYMISADGEPVALVADLEMARAIARCQPWGDYLVESLEVGEPIVARRPRPQPSPPEIRPGGPSPAWRPGVHDPDIPTNSRARRPAR